MGTPPDAVAVPTHFFKVVLGRRRDGSFATAGFILPNRAIPEKKALVDFLTPIDVIEKHAGLLFFGKVCLVYGGQCEPATNLRSSHLISLPCLYSCKESRKPTSVARPSARSR